MPTKFGTAYLQWGGLDCRLLSTQIVKFFFSFHISNDSAKYLCLNFSVQSLHVGDLHSFVSPREINPPHIPTSNPSTNTLCPCHPSERSDSQARRSGLAPLPVPRVLRRLRGGSSFATLVHWFMKSMVLGTAIFFWDLSLKAISISKRFIIILQSLIFKHNLHHFLSFLIFGVLDITISCNSVQM